MKSYLGLGLAMLAGAVLGAVGMSALHAQAKPPAYVIAELDVTNEDGFLKEFTPLAQKALAESGNKAIVRGGKIVMIEGAPAKRIVINSFANLDVAVAAYDSAAYKDARKIGDKYAKFRLIAVEGLAQ